MVLMHRGPLWTIHLLLQAVPGSVVRRLVRLINYRIAAIFGGRLFFLSITISDHNGIPWTKADDT